jgi:uncharacterized protein (DUF58 family)
VIGVGDVAGSQQRLRNLELVVTKNLDGLLQGDYQGLVPAGGSDPADGREYSPGDDVRRMDWNLTARSGHPHIRTTIADRELETWIVVDSSASLDFGTAACEKRDLALAAAAAFAFLTVRNGNRVAASMYGSASDAFLPPRGGRDGALALLHRLDRRPRPPAGAAGTLAGALRKVRLSAKRRGLVVVISDLIDDSDWSRELRALAARHDVVVVDIRDPREAMLPAVGLLTLVDPESGARIDVQTSNAKVRARFAEAAAAQRADRDRAIRRAGASQLILSTDDDWLRAIVHFVVRRRRRR